MGDNSLWHSHGRMNGIQTLRTTLKLEIEDFSKDIKLSELIRAYNDILCEFIVRNKINVFFHNRVYF